MKLQSRVASLEASRPKPSTTWRRCIVRPDVETLGDVLARDFCGVEPARLIVRTLVKAPARGSLKAAGSEET